MKVFFHYRIYLRILLVQNYHFLRNLQSCNLPSVKLSVSVLRDAPAILTSRLCLLHKALCLIFYILD